MDYSPQQGFEYRSIRVRDVQNSKDYWGFAFWRSDMIPSTWTLRVPHWFLMFVTFPLAIPWILGWRKSARIAKRRALGQCPSCGYDMRGMPDRCPECGYRPSEIAA
jgi:hypothetical protein